VLVRVRLPRPTRLDHERHLGLRGPASASGERLADTIAKYTPMGAIDVVMPIPDSSRPAAMQVARKLGLEYREGFYKNRYIGRTFIMPGQAVRKKSVRQKLNAMSSEFKGKNVLLIDDSIVRGTTSKEIIQMARDAGSHTASAHGLRPSRPRLAPSRLQVRS
jgi:amidophosphoribosyltransferase